MVLMILLCNTSNVLGQNRCMKDSLHCFFIKNKIKEVTFDLFYFTKDKWQQNGPNGIGGNINLDTVSFYLLGYDKKRGLVEHSFDAPDLMINSLLGLIDTLFISKTRNPILKEEMLDLEEYGDKNILQIKIVRDNKNDNKYEFAFGDYSQSQIVYSKTITFSTQLIRLFKTIEAIKKHGETALALGAE